MSVFFDPEPFDPMAHETFVVIDGAGVGGGKGSGKGSGKGDGGSEGDGSISNRSLSTSRRLSRREGGGGRSCGDGRVKGVGGSEGGGRFSNRRSEHVGRTHSSRQQRAQRPKQGSVMRSYDSLNES